ncbi:MAG TPA: addiction module antidote protein, HigA family [Leucothrix mucor]|uniref:Addiction module antidote protein, HigA family n=1 Tax=Leucothrix mucor TaxID=45248 RepID=A0A7V2T2P3_LEUMU|nr:addiction module antidote protein, HigA family [Leucothrix mucor]
MAMHKPAHPGIILGEDILKEMKITITEGASRLGISRKTLSLVVNGKARIQADLAVKLEIVFNKPSAEHWLRMQSAYDLYYARLKMVA